MYLTEDAKLWRQTCLSDDINENRDKIETLRRLKRELKEKFLPRKTVWIVNESFQN